MSTQFPIKNLFNLSCIFLGLTLPLYAFSQDDYYTSKLYNESKKDGSIGFRLVRTRVWPNATCVINTGKEIINPGEVGEIGVKKATECNESGIGYEIYQANDTNNKHLFGYVSHRLADGKFSVQVSRFCEGGKCVFKGLNPEQTQ